MHIAPSEQRDEPLSYADLGARVWLEKPPARLLEELPDLYGSVFSTELWFRIFDGVEVSGVCLLEEPRHVLAFWIDGDTAEVLNKAFPMSPRDAERACRALLRALPAVQRIHLEVTFPPADLHLPRRVLYAADDMVVDLPASADEYYASLGKRTRKNVRNFENRLRREHPDVVTTIAEAGDRAGDLMDQFLRWHLARAERQGIVSGYVTRPAQFSQVTELVRGAAEAQTTTIDGRLAAVEFVFFVGAEATLYAGSFDAAYEGLELGFLSTYWAIRETARRGARRCHLLWGTDYYKTLLGACPVAATRLSVFRSEAARLRSLGEAREVAWRRTKRRCHRDYWRLRHKGRRVLGLGRGEGSTSRPG